MKKPMGWLRMSPMALAALRMMLTTSWGGMSRTLSMALKKVQAAPKRSAMMPAASVSGIYLAHPAARYFSVGRVGRDQVEDYARRKGWSVEQAKKWLAPLLG